MARTGPFERYSDKSNASVFYKEATFYSAQEVSRYLTDAGFGNLTYKQTLIPGKRDKLVQNGLGKGAFVVAKGMKNG